MSIKPTPFDNFIDVFVDELIAMPDDQVLEGSDPAVVQAAGLQLLNNSKAEARKRRFAAAKAGVTSSNARSVVQSKANVSLDEARKYVARAANDHRYTLAARNLGEMSDEDVMRLYVQMKALEKVDGHEKDSE